MKLKIPDNGLKNPETFKRCESTLLILSKTKTFCMKSHLFLRISKNVNEIVLKVFYESDE
jgi:hypothetical protein